MSKGDAPDDRSSRPRGWARLKRPLTWLFFGLVAWLLVTNAREIAWAEVGDALLAIPRQQLMLAGGLALLGHGIYACYDLVSRHWVGFELGTARVMLTAFISYAFNLNLGSLVGGLGFRYRLYSRQGLDDGQITRTIAFSMATNWLGYIALAGVLFLFRPLALPPDWPLGAQALRAIGAILVMATLAWLLACAFARQRRWTVRGHSIDLPSLRLALLQLAVAAVNWMVIGAILWVLFDQRIEHSQVLTVLLVAAVAGVITHVPAGLGVLEAVFVTLLGDRLPTAEILGALLAYRALYYLAPLVVATLAWIGVEARARREPMP